MTYQFMGVDPGPSCGIALLRYTPSYERQMLLSPWDWLVLQVNGAKAVEIAAGLIDHYQPKWLFTEKFIPSNRAGTTGKDAELTREINHNIEEFHRRRVAETTSKWDAMYGGRQVSRPAAHVKPWSSDKRLTVTGFPMGPKFKDGRDGGRHVLFGAVKDGGARDPLA